MKYAQANHHHWQRVLDTALTVQDVAVMQAEDREELSLNLADATAAAPTWSTCAHSAGR